MQTSSQNVVAQLIKDWRPTTILDAPCGEGWLAEAAPGVFIDGIDLYARPQKGYRKIFDTDLDGGLPPHLPRYELIACCEGIEHLGNPLLFLQSTKKHLLPNGRLLITTPNIWYPMGKVQFFARGFFPGFPCLAGKIKAGSHMHIMPWSFPQLHLYLKLAGFSDVQLHKEPLSQPKYFFERFLALPQRLYCRKKLKTAKGVEEKDFWEICGSDGSILGRHLIISAR